MRVRCSRSHAYSAKGFERSIERAGLWRELSPFSEFSAGRGAGGTTGSGLTSGTGEAVAVVRLCERCPCERTGGLAMVGGGGGVAAEAGAGAGTGVGAGTATGAGAGIGAGVGAGTWTGSAGGAGVAACCLGSRCRPNQSPRTSKSTAIAADPAQTTTRDRLPAGTSSDRSTFSSVIGAGTAIAGSETGDFMVPAMTKGNPACERSGVTARPKNGISASMSSTTEA